MKKFFLNAMIVGTTSIMMLGCSQNENLIDDVASISVDTRSNTKELVLTPSEQVALAVQKKGTYKISEDEVRRNFDKYAKGFYQGKATTVKNLSLKKDKTSGKDLYYEMTFENEKGKGFSILSADERVDKLLCYVENGSISDTTFNKSLKFCLDLIDNYVKAQTAKELDVESLVLSANEKIATTSSSGDLVTRALPYFDPDNPSSSWTFEGTDVTEDVEERIELVPGGWHQNPPFNDYLPILRPNKRAYVGCVMIATSQVMAYHKKPFSNYITTSTWNSMIDNIDGGIGIATVELKTLMLDLFNAMQTDYDESGTESNLNEARAFLNSNSYTAGSKIDFSFEAAWNALAYGPTIMGGKDSNDDGHAWVIDGVHKTTVTSVDVYTTTYNGRVYEATTNYSSYSHRMLKYDWGWGNGYDNGWFNYGIFTPLEDVISPFDDDLEMLSYIY